MADEFDRFLSDALAPEERDVDRTFVSRVQARIALDECLRAERRSVLRRLGAELLAIGAVAVALLWLGRAETVAGFFADSPAMALTSLLSAFAFLVFLFSSRTSGASPRQVELRLISNA
jgi:hypothetical protein